MSSQKSSRKKSSTSKKASSLTTRKGKSNLFKISYDHIIAGYTSEYIRSDQNPEQRLKELKEQFPYVNFKIEEVKGKKPSIIKEEEWEKVEWEEQYGTWTTTGYALKELGIDLTAEIIQKFENAKVNPNVTFLWMEHFHGDVEDIFLWREKGWDNPIVAGFWYHEGFTPDEANEWGEVFENPSEAIHWKKKEFNPKEAKMWLDLRIEYDHANIFKQLGIDLETAKKWIQFTERQRLYLDTFLEEYLKRIVEFNMTPEKIEQWIEEKGYRWGTKDLIDLLKAGISPFENPDEVERFFTNRFFGTEQVYKTLTQEQLIAFDSKVTLLRKKFLELKDIYYKISEMGKKEDLERLKLSTGFLDKDFRDILKYGDQIHKAFLKAKTDKVDFAFYKDLWEKIDNLREERFQIPALLRELEYHIEEIKG